MSAPESMLSSEWADRLNVISKEIKKKYLMFQFNDNQIVFVNELINNYNNL